VGVRFASTEQKDAAVSSPMRVDVAALRGVTARISAQEPVVVAQAQRIDDIEGGPECAGRDYADLGAKYVSLMRAHLVQSMQAFGAAILVVADNLAETSRSYASTERANEVRLAP
jgi:hypothetical protein